MAKHPFSRYTGRQALHCQPRRPLYRMLAFCMATTAGSGTALAQSTNLPTPNTVVNLNPSGNAAPDQSGGTGTASNGGTAGLGDGQTASYVLFRATGGAGGTGADGSKTSGGGGNGGAGGPITFTMDPGSYVNSGALGAAISLLSAGGAGAIPGELGHSIGNPGQPGGGGDAGTILFNQSGSVASTSGWNGSTPGATAVLMTSVGGNAGEPQDIHEDYNDIWGAGGNAGGMGGSITYNLAQGNVTSNGSAIVALSEGGNGGDGTGATSLSAAATGGAGGQGGDGGDVSMTIGQGASTPTITAVGAPTAATGVVVPIDTNGNTATAAFMAAGIQAQSIGSQGGAGGEADGPDPTAGNGGSAGSAGAINIALNSANISTTGFAAAGVLGQSIGGSGGNGGGAGGIFFQHSGNGAAGGNAGTVSVTMGDSANTV